MNNAPAWLLYSPKYEVLICSIHGYAILNLASHLAKKHANLDLNSRRTIIADHAHLHLCKIGDALRHTHGPRDPILAIAGLAVHDGFACNDCSFLSISRKRLKVHCKAEHGWSLTRADPVHWTDVRLQTLFAGSGAVTHYLCVLPDACANSAKEAASLSSRSEDDLVEDISRQWAHTQQQQEAMRQVLAKGTLKHETTNWLKRSGWPAHFEGRDLSEIYLCSQMPGKNSKELRRMNAAIDRLFFSRCIDGIKNLPLMMRLLLASPHYQDAHSRPFGPLQEKASMDRNVAYWKRFFCYCLNVLELDDSRLVERHGFTFTTPQRRGLEQLRRHLLDDKCLEEALEEELLQLSASFWMQRLDGDPFVSPLWHFVAVLGIDGESGQLRPAHLFTYVLAGLVYVGRAVLAEWTTSGAESAEEDLGTRFATIRNAWLCKASYSPMGYTLSLLLYGRAISRETGSRLMVSWSKRADIMYFMGKPIQMDNLRSMVADMTTDAEDMLWNTLMFKDGQDFRYTVPLDSIEDDLTYTQRGKSFIHRNGLAGKELDMLRDIVGGSRKQEFLNDDGRWNWDAVQRYLKKVMKFLEVLIVLIQMTWGQPARGEEITGLRLVNGINRDRNVFIIDGQVVLVSQYHKSLAHFDSPKVIPRFLPDRVGQLLVMYMIYIRSLTDRWEGERGAMSGKIHAPSDFIWALNGGPQESSWMSQAMGRCTQRYLGRQLSLQPWRHVVIAISRRLAREQGRVRADFDKEEDDDNDGEQYQVADDLAAAHTGNTAANYGVTIDIIKKLSADSLETFRQVSHRWHQFLGLVDADRGVSAGKRKNDSGPLQKPTSKRPRILPLDWLSSEQASNDAILSALRSILRDDRAQFWSPQQEEAVRLASAKETPLVAVLPTGAGKSLIFMVPAMLHGAGITVVVAPYAALKQQLATRCIDAGLDCKLWPEARYKWPRIVLISAEAASGDDFLEWAAEACSRGAVDRIVIDECHLSFTAADKYRSKLRGLVLLRQLGCPMVFLTGTLPVLRQREFEEAMQLQNPYYIRASSHRLNVKFSVVRVKNGRGPMEVRRMVLAQRPELKPGEKGVIYCKSRAKCQVLARQLQCHYYHSDPHNGDAQFLARREAGFQAWARGDMPYIVATAALGTGIDIAGITHVIHLESPSSIIDYAQESGRAGRAGEHVSAEIIVEDKDWPLEDEAQDWCLELDVREVNRLIRTKGCRRSILGLCLDSDIRKCQQIPGAAVLCDNCERENIVWKSELSSQGLILSQAHGRRIARGLERLEMALEEVKGLGQWGCRMCWMFDGRHAATLHQWTECPKIGKDITFEASMRFQRQLDYRRDRQAQFLSCFYCHVSQQICKDGYQTKGATCRQTHVVIPVVLAAKKEETLWKRVWDLAGKQIVDEAAYAEWLGRKHCKLVCGQEMTNVMAVFDLVLQWRIELQIKGAKLE